jgi:peptidoglycan/xylan/chitin deacetylase (PgdA/CDA1 family)
MMEKLRLEPELWELFTKKEEYKPILLDQHLRFPSYVSKHKELFQPIVSDFLHMEGYRVEYPHQKKFAVCLTHDIDIIHFPKFQMVQKMAAFLKKRKGKKILDLARGRIHRKWNPLRNFNRIMELEEKYKAKSTFFFLCLKRQDFDFSFRIEKMKDEVRDINQRGWGIGLQGGHEAYNNIDNMKREKERLEDIAEVEVVGYRNHYMKFRVPLTWELLEKAGFKYDSTFGYADCVGFRNGMCHPFQPFNLNTNRILDILEIPSHIADFSIFEYMHLDDKGAWELVSKLIDKVERVNGVLTILWHNNYMLEEMFDFYERILRVCFEKGAWMTSGEEMLKFWLERGF